MKTRKAIVEGRFYPSSPHGIRSQIRAIERLGRYPDIPLEPARIFGAVLPHAGHIYSGHQTIPLFRLLKRTGKFPRTFVIVHPNHTGLGNAMAIDDSDSWQNAMGEVLIDREFADAIPLPKDARAHAMEHSAEVIIPFLQYYMGANPFSIVPVCMMEQTLSNANSLSRSIVRAEEETGRTIMVLASSDFSHFLAPEKGWIQDQKVLDQILNRNAGGVESVVKKAGISVCGYGPIMTLMTYSEHFGKGYKMKILARGHSGEVHPSSEVVDYVSMIFYR